MFVWSLPQIDARPSFREIVPRLDEIKREALEADALAGKPFAKMRVEVEKKRKLSISPVPAAAPREVHL